MLIEEFIRTGLVTIPGAMSRDVTEAWVQQAFTRIGIDERDNRTWAGKSTIHPRTRTVPLSELAPSAWSVICEILGGAGAIEARTAVGHDGFNLNCDREADKPWQPPSAQSPGWHKDGWFFKHFLDSPEQALLVLLIWRDILPQSGGTFYAPDSVPLVIRELATHPEGVDPDYPFAQQIHQCRDFREVTAQAGDVIIMHPFMLHAASGNPSGRIRVMNNKVISLNQPLQLNRADGRYTPLERTFLNALGVEPYDFKIAGARERTEDFSQLVEQRRKQKLALAGVAV